MKRLLAALLIVLVICSPAHAATYTDSFSQADEDPLVALIAAFKRAVLCLAAAAHR